MNPTFKETSLTMKTQKDLNNEHIVIIKENNVKSDILLSIDIFYTLRVDI